MDVGVGYFYHIFYEGCLTKEEEQQQQQTLATNNNNKNNNNNNNNKNNNNNNNNANKRRDFSSSQFCSSKFPFILFLFFVCDTCTIVNLLLIYSKLYYINYPIKFHF